MLKTAVLLVGVVAIFFQNGVYGDYVDPNPEIDNDALYDCAKFQSCESCKQPGVFLQCFKKNIDETRAEIAKRVPNCNIPIVPDFFYCKFKEAEGRDCQKRAIAAMRDIRREDEGKNPDVQGEIDNFFKCTSEVVANCGSCRTPM